MKNKILLAVVIILIPLTVISFLWKTNFNMEEEELKKEEIYVNYENDKMLLDDYVYHVVAAEMPASFENEALKAQILATRTYTLNKLEANKEFVFTKNLQAFNTEDELKQKWDEDYEKYSNKIKELVGETKNEIVTYEGKPIEAYYFSMSNGKTTNALAVFGTNKDYLQSVDSTIEDSSLNNFTVKKKISLNEFSKILELNLPITIGDIKKDDSNRVLEIVINNKTFNGIDIRKKLNLRSTDFTIDVQENEVIITTNGYGHGVGLSQYGANLMAKEGFNYIDILKKYYTGVEITKIYE